MHNKKIKNKNITFYSLLFFEKNEKITNLSRILNKNKDYIYSKMALNLSKSIHNLGYQHVLVTNDKLKIRKLVNYKYPLKELKFKKILDSNTRFYSAHYKIDVFKYLSNKKNRSCLLDLDILIVKKFTKKFLSLSKHKNLIFSLNYDSGYNKKINFIFEKLCKFKIYKPKWYGGEFILGNSLFFKRLYIQIMKIYPNYKKNLNNFFFIGDETLTNSALQILLNKKKISFYDIRNCNFITRYWSILNYDLVKLNSVLRNIFLHLPSDKLFLSKNDISDYEYTDIKKMYLNYHQSYSRKILYLIQKLKRCLIKLN